MIRVAWWTCALFALATARVYERCELAQELMSYGVDKNHISTWVCIAFHESRLDTSAQNHGSGDHGIFQISELYWCGPGKACGVPCTAFRDENIRDDVECSLMIHKEHTRLQGDGFMAWVVYPQHCRQSTKKYLADCSGFPKNTTTKTSYNSYKTKVLDFVDNNVTYSYNPSVGGGQQPSYLTVSAFVNNNFVYDFEQNYTKSTPRNWLNYKIDNIDELTLPVFSNKAKPVTIPQAVTPTYFVSSTTSAPTVPPVKPWRTIETNQFRNKIRNDNKDSEKVNFGKDSTKFDKFETSYFAYRKSPTVASTIAPTTYTTPAIYSKPSTYRSQQFTTTTTTTYKPQEISYKPVIVSTTSRRFPVPTTTLRPVSTSVSYRYPSSSTLRYTQPPISTKRSWFEHQTFTKQPVVKLTPRPNFSTKSWSTLPPLTTRRINPATYKSPQQRTTQSIFDLYLNPTKRPQLSSYKFSSNNDSPFKLRIFAGGTTTPSPFFKGGTFGGASRNQLRRDTQFST